MIKKNLVVGSNGFLGRHLCEYLFRQGDTVVGVYNKNKENLFQDVKQIQIEKLLYSSEEFSTIYITGAFISNSSKEVDLIALFNANVLLLEQLCAKFKNAKFIYCSSVSVYGNSEDELHEDSKINLESSYAISKFWGEEIIKKQKEYSILRISSIYGSGMNLSTFLPKIVIDAIKTKQIILFGEGNRKQNYIHVSDVVKYLYRAALYKKNATFLAVGKESISNQKIALEITQTLKGVSLTYEGEDNSPSYIYDNSKTNKMLKFEPLIEIKEGIKLLIEWKKK